MEENNSIVMLFELFLYRNGFKSNQGFSEKGPFYLNHSRRAMGAVNPSYGLTPNDSYGAGGAVAVSWTLYFQLCFTRILARKGILNFCMVILQDIFMSFLEEKKL